MQVSLFMVSKTIPLSFILLNLGTAERKGKNYNNLNISTKKSFLDKIKTFS